MDICPGCEGTRNGVTARANYPFAKNKVVAFGRDRETNSVRNSSRKFNPVGKYPMYQNLRSMRK